MCDRKRNEESLSNMRDCRFCCCYKDNLTLSRGVIIDNDPVIIESEHFYVTSDLHPISECHLLVVSKHHYDSMAVLSNELVGELELLCDKIYSRLRNRPNAKWIAFEHGSGGVVKPSLNSVDHFHLHIVMCDADVISAVEHKVDCTLCRLQSIFDIQKQVGKDYVFIRENDGKMWCVNVESGSICSQLMRRVIFEHNRETLAGFGVSTYDWKKENFHAWYKHSSDIIRGILKD